MKYERLTKEQFNALQQEFINFLATQSITGKEWETIKSTKPEVAEEELDVFSDLVWEGVLNTTRYLEHFSKDQIYLFFLGPHDMKLIVIKVENPEIDITTQEGYTWLQNNLLDDSIQILRANKEYSDDKNEDKFKLIQQGAQITKGALYQYFEKLVA